MDPLDEKIREMCAKYIYQPSIISAKKRIIAIGDLHGDYTLTVNSLKLAKVINDNLKWIGNDTHVVQVGDQIDRCRPINTTCDDIDSTDDDEGSDIKIMKLFTELDEQAQKVGGRVISLLGNHELMNVLGNLNYVSYEGLREFENYRDPYTGQIFKDGKKGRKHAFAPGNEYGRFLACTRLSAVIIGSFIFIHAGIIPEFLNKLDISDKKDIELINKRVKQWLLGLINKEYIDNIVGSFEYSPFWNRILGSIPVNMSNEDPACRQYLDPVLKLFNLKYMVIGHTPQFFNNQAGINSTCSNRLWRVDNGSSNAFNKFDNEYIKTGVLSDFRKVQVLEILNDKDINILS